MSQRRESKVQSSSPLTQPGPQVPRFDKFLMLFFLDPCDAEILIGGLRQILTFLVLVILRENLSSRNEDEPCELQNLRLIFQTVEF